MRRFKPKRVLDIQQDPEGPFVLYADAIEAMQAGLSFALAHREDIDADINDFGVLKPLLDMVRAGGKTH